MQNYFSPFNSLNNSLSFSKRITRQTKLEDLDQNSQIIFSNLKQQESASFGLKQSKDIDMYLAKSIGDQNKWGMLSFERNFQDSYGKGVFSMNKSRSRSRPGVLEQSQNNCGISAFQPGFSNNFDRQYEFFGQKYENYAQNSQSKPFILFSDLEQQNDQINMKQLAKDQKKEKKERIQKQKPVKIPKMTKKELKRQEKMERQKMLEDVDRSDVESCDQNTFLRIDTVEDKRERIQEKIADLIRINDNFIQNTLEKNRAVYDFYEDFESYDNIEQGNRPSRGSQITSLRDIFSKEGKNPALTIEFTTYKSIDEQKQIFQKNNNIKKTDYRFEKVQQNQEYLIQTIKNMFGQEKEKKPSEFIDIDGVKKYKCRYCDKVYLKNNQLGSFQILRLNSLQIGGHISKVHKSKYKYINIVKKEEQKNRLKLDGKSKSIKKLFKKDKKEKQISQKKAEKQPEIQEQKHQIQQKNMLKSITRSDFIGTSQFKFFENNQDKQSFQQPQQLEQNDKLHNSSDVQRSFPVPKSMMKYKKKFENSIQFSEQKDKQNINKEDQEFPKQEQINKDDLIASFEDLDKID